MTTELVIVENLKLVPFFTKGDQVQSILERLTEEANSFVAGDLSVGKNRKAVTEMVTKFTKTKTYLERKGKELAAEYKAIPKAIDANRKLVKDTITELQESVRKPLTDWEEEQSAIEAAELAAKEAAALVVEVADCEERAVLINDNFDREAKAQKEKLKLELMAKEKDIKEKAAIEATELAEKKAQQEIQRIKNEKEQLVIDAKNAELRRISDIENARASEVARQVAEQKKQDEEQRQRAANKEHSRIINNNIVQCILATGITEAQAKHIVVMIAKGQVPNISIIY